MAANGYNLVFGYTRNRGPAIVRVAWTFTTLAIIAVGARLFGTLKLTRKLGLDDFFIVLSMFFGFLYAVFTTAAVAAGSGDQRFIIGPGGVLEAFKWNGIAFIPGMIALSLPTLAVVSHLSKVLEPRIGQKVFIYFLGGSNVFFTTLCAVFLWAQCKPAAAIYTSSLNATCWSPVVLIVYSTVIGTYSASVNLYLTLYMAASLHEMCKTPKQKIGLSFLTSIGVIVFVIAMYNCLRLPALYNSELYNNNNYAFEINATSDLLIWTSIESNLIIIVTCLSTIRPVCLYFSGKHMANYKRRQRNKNNNDENDQSFKLHSFGKGTRLKGESFPVYEAFPVYSNDVGLLQPQSVERRPRTESSAPLMEHEPPYGEDDAYSVYSVQRPENTETRRHSRVPLMEREVSDNNLLKPEDAQRRKRMRSESRVTFVEPLEFGE